MWRWQERYLAQGIDGLRRDATRPGRKPPLTAEVIAEVVEKTRTDSQPRFIEAVNYRFKGHSVVDPDKYRSEEEKEHWRQDDPVLRFEKRLEDARIVSREDLRKVQADVEKEIEEIVRFSDESPNPKVEELYRYVYAGEWEAAHA